tara:strand:- start:222 stop:665 length:444 start_codon:yes stop_codon:yes gene_type:complete
MAILKDVAVYWASLSDANTRWEPHTFQATAVVSKKIAAEFESKGHRIKEINEEPALFFKQYANKPDGSPNPPIRVVDENKNPFDEAVGNGSIVNIQYEEKVHDNKFGKFPWLQLKAVQVMRDKHVPYNRDESVDEFDIEGDADDIEF